MKFKYFVYFVFPQIVNSRGEQIEKLQPARKWESGHGECVSTTFAAPRNGPRWPKMPTRLFNVAARHCGPWGQSSW